MNNSFLSSGDLGDIIVSLPAVKAVGGGTYYLANRPWTKNISNRAHLIAPLLEAQPYIKKVVVGDAPVNGDRLYDFSTFRQNGLPFGVRLAHLHSRHVGVAVESLVEPWLVAPQPRTDLAGTVVFARSHRYRNMCFPWKKIADSYKGCSVFIGIPEEHKDFEENFGPIPYLPTKNLLEVANVITGSFMFVGNQSSPNAVADGLAHRKCLEVCLFQPDCIYPRNNTFFGYGQVLELPHPTGVTIITEPWAPPVELDQTTTPPGGWQFTTLRGTVVKHISWNTCVRLAMQTTASEGVPMSLDAVEDGLEKQTFARLPGYGVAGWAGSVFDQWDATQNLIDGFAAQAGIRSDGLFDMF